MTQNQEAETPHPSPVDYTEVVRAATPTEEIGGFLATIAAQSARIAELEKERDELEGRNIINRNAVEHQKRHREAAESRLSDAVKVIEEIASRGPTEEPPPAYDSWGYRSEGNASDIAQDFVAVAMWEVAQIARSFLSTGGDSHG